MGNTLATDTIPVLVTMVDVHNPKAQDQFYFCNVSTGGASTKVIGRSQTLSVEVGITTVLSCVVYECPEPIFTPETAQCLGTLRIPIDRLAERYSSGIFQQWFNLDTRTDPRMPAGDPVQVTSRFEQAYADAVVDVYQPKICISVIGSAFEVQRGSRQACSIFVGEDVKTQAGPDLKALIASHKQQAAYIDALHEELRRVNMPSYRPMGGDAGVGRPMPMQPMASPGGPAPSGAMPSMKYPSQPMPGPGGPGAPPPMPSVPTVPAGPAQGNPSFSVGGGMQMPQSFQGQDMEASLQGRPCGAPAYNSMPASAYPTVGGGGTMAAAMPVRNASMPPFAGQPIPSGIASMQ